ncbi:MAG: TonB-dependent receptor [Sphingomonadales bacterium]|nr:TonB-dependent receptor [Sphingomonadales bacterium]
MTLAIAFLAAAAVSEPPMAAPSATPPAASEIVVIGERQRGAVPGAIAAESSLNADAVAGLGASNLADILAQIAALTGGAQGRVGDGPLLLVNGRRIGSFDEVKNLPPEAIERVEVLPEEAALRLGYPARSKPVNVVLKRAYAAVTGELEDRVTARGLRNDFNTEYNAVRIAGDNRITLDVQYQIGDSITEAKRGVVRPLDRFAASDTGLVLAADGGLLAPLALTGAGVPVAGRTLAQFAAAPLADTTAPWRDIVPATQQFTAAGALNRALGNGLTLAVNARFDALASREQLGPAIVETAIPAASALPFTVALRERRVLPDEPVQVRRIHTDTAHLGAQVAGNGAWRWSVAGKFDRVLARRESTGGVDATAWNAAVASGTVADPFAAPPAALLTARPATHARSRDDTLAGDGFASGTVAQLPAGAVNLSLATALGRETLASDDSTGHRTLARNHLGGQAALALPLLAPHSALGALDAGASLAGDRWSDSGTLASFGGNLTWRPARQVSLLLAWSRDGAPPTMAQRGAPLDTTPAVAVQDYVTGRSTIAARTTGGDPGLRPDRRTLWKAELNWKPVRGLGLTGTFTHIDDRDPVFAFGGVTPAFAAAFPGRISRDAQGNLLAIDSRPVNAAAETRDELRLSASLNRDFGKAGGPRVPGGGGFGGGHAFGAQGSMVQASLTDTVRLSDTLVLVPGAQPLDLVAGNPLGDGLRVPRHRVEAQVSGTHHGFGLRANAVWTSGGAAGTGSAGELRFADRLAMNVRLFWFPARTPGIGPGPRWLQGVRLLLAIDNAFDTWQRVTDRAGQTPLAFQRGLVEPLGRTIRLSIRKTLD